ncbi:8-oxo-dGTP diphosphatase [Paenibacillus apiarius]|uniref:8-oxo-dGTP diphosphatase n=1 Tax=Paenibacillus apiarius TaxID=46240 RepID=A0ABT4DW47_9BACL|nr:8-oxo-dGTP diphosphatase [Paenibacillus apiarius]MCY9513055.1 8-oxo-dGTP diphosphatase [Paenibacillus apiarius]MCY9521587.1 8-oxo-dGTP diphosphatase [Paenibacillus apiarius]MCY9551741.1 8-oxo-dGTP diphosphatase [Paenibacillus apiarius]MCY9560471.1 8-oxo-dGTP diphosphatase [Paenibacillus apiarius]MCY9685279.1 8-oxo-dGTP diphosphatase [Paenibacillus apiarius]
MTQQEVKYGMYTMCLVQDGDRVLLINRPNERGFPGYLGPGGKVDFPESLSEGAIREVYEETGLRVKNLIYKGLDEYVVPQKNYRYMVFNYVADSYEGELLANPPEGELLWVSIEEAMELPMQPWFKRRFPLFFEAGTFEISVVWDEDANEPIEESIKILK